MKQHSRPIDYTAQGHAGYFRGKAGCEFDDGIDGGVVEDQGGRMISCEVGADDDSCSPGLLEDSAEPLADFKPASSDEDGIE